MCKIVIQALLVLMLPINLLSQTVAISGERMLWHNITVSLNVNNLTIPETTVTFKNYRYDVEFIAPNASVIRVPGYFAADGNAANTSKAVGNVFKAHLRPNIRGTWKYRLYLYRGEDIATRSVSSLPEPFIKKEGVIGTVNSSNKVAPDFRSKGRLMYQTTGFSDQRRYLRFQGTGDYFLKLGPDSPENLLNYTDIDFEGAPAICSSCKTHSYAPHLKDYKSSELVWGTNQRGKGVLGALNYVSAQGMNAMSLSLLGGDDLNVFPWVWQNYIGIYDVSKLAQWERVFEHAQRNGLQLQFKLAERENWDALTAQELKVYYREMVARFGHHLAIEWNISEEYGGVPSSALERIDWLAEIDPYQSPRVIHTYPNEHAKYDAWLGSKAKLTGASIQSSTIDNYDHAYNGASGILTWINKAQAANQTWVVCSDEQNPGSTGVFTSAAIENQSVIPEARSKILWKSLLAGGAGVLWYGGSEGDFETENFNRFTTLFNWSRYAVNQFFKGQGVPFWRMQNRDDLVTGTTNYCLAEVGVNYVLYLENGGSSSLNLSGLRDTFKVYWFDPRNGGGLKTGSVESLQGGGFRSIGLPPSQQNLDWTALIVRDASVPTPPMQPTISICEADYEAQNGTVIIEAENLNYAGTDWKLRKSKVGYTGEGYLSYEGPNYFGSPGNSPLTATIKINEAGTYRFKWRSTYGMNGATGDYNDTWLRFPDASNFYAYKDSNVVFPIGSGRTPNPTAGGGVDGWFKLWHFGDGNWSWYTKTWDNNGHDIFLDFKEPGVYTMELSGRSKFHIIDRIYISKYGLEAEDLTLLETTCGSIANDTVPFETNFTIYPNDDVYIDPSTAVGYNTSYISSIPAYRPSFYRFDLSQIRGTITSMELELTAAANGSGNMNIFQSPETSWKETAINRTNIPEYTSFIANYNGIYNANQSITIAINPNKLEEITNQLTLTMQQSAGSELLFYSKESGIAVAPRLKITVQNSMGGRHGKSIVGDMEVYPNPSNGIVMITGSNLQGSRVQLVDGLGRILREDAFLKSEIKLDLRSFSKGQYFVRVVSQDAQIVKKIVLD